MLVFTVKIHVVQMICNTAPDKSLENFCQVGCNGYGAVVLCMRFGTLLEDRGDVLVFEAGWDGTCTE